MSCSRPPAEVHSYVRNASVDHDRTKTDCESAVTRHCYRYTPPRPFEEIDADFKQLGVEIQALLAEVTL